MDRLRGVFDARFEGKLTFSLEQTQLAGACDSFGASLDLHDNPFPFLGIGYSVQDSLGLLNWTKKFCLARSVSGSLYR